MEKVRKDNHAIELNNVNISFVDRSEKLEVVNDISFSVKNHEFVSILGPSGCGKSTLFHTIADIIDQHTIQIDGSISVLGLTTQKARENRRIGVIFQKPTLLPWRTIKSNILLPLEIIGDNRKIKEIKVEKLLSLVSLSKYGGYYPDMLSGGMQQKVAIARALAYNPSLLLMDEPFAALDEISRRQMNEELIKIWKETKKTILFVTHSIAEAVYLSQKIIVLSPRPGTVKTIITVDFPYPRNKVENSDKFFHYINEIRNNLKE